MRVIKQKGPWKILKSRVKYKNPWMTVIEDQVIRPDGKDGIFGTVDIKNGVAVIALDDKGFVYLTKEYHYGIEKYSLEVASGGIDGKESPLKAAKRELLEETGIKAKKWTYLGYNNPLTTYSNAKNHIFLAQDISFFESNPEGTELIEVVKMELEKALEMVLKSEITHTSSMLALLLVEKHLKKTS